MCPGRLELKSLVAGNNDKITAGNGPDVVTAGATSKITLGNGNEGNGFKLFNRHE